MKAILVLAVTLLIGIAACCPTRLPAGGHHWRRSHRWACSDAALYWPGAPNSPAEGNHEIQLGAPGSYHLAALHTVTKTYPCSGICGQTACSFTEPNVAAATFGQGGCMAAAQIDANGTLRFSLTAPPGTPIGQRFSCQKVVRITYR
jgi:hypothetical protein